jgi:hypothetical protein
MYKQIQEINDGVMQAQRDGKMEFIYTTPLTDLSKEILMNALKELEKLEDPPYIYTVIFEKINTIIRWTKNNGRN